MPGTAKTGKTPSVGPDWPDIAMVMRAIENTHSATLVLQVRADGSLYGGSVSVEVAATLPVLTGKGQPLRLSRYSVWPSVKSRTMEGLVYQLLLSLDHAIGAEHYKQATMPLSPPDD